MLRDMTSNTALKRALSPAAATTDNTAYVTQILDTRDYGAVMLSLNIGTLADADVTVTVLMEESNSSNMSGAVAVADADLNGTEVLAAFQFDDDNECRKIGYVGNMRYIRATITPANNTGNFFLSGTWVCRPMRRPAENPPA